jgi:dihydroorotate dehydrogenase (NAD+) catalytic subunit
MTRMTITSAPAKPAPRLDVDMSTDLAGLTLPNPITTASGCAAAGQEIHQFVDVADIGAIVTKSVMTNPRSGRATPRMSETPSGMLNSIGLQGPGIDAFLERDLPWLADHGARAIVSIAGGSVEEYARLASRLRTSSSIAALEVNISCPNVEDRGQVFACDPRAASEVIAAVRRSTAPGVPVFAKLSPDVTDIVSIARACVDAGADGLSMINTLLGMVIDTESMAPLLGGVTGGLSGPAIRPVAVRCIYQVHAALPDVPIIGMGGVKSGEDAFEMILAGASAVSVGTVVFHDPSAPARINAELRELLAARGFDRLTDAIGFAHRVDPPAAPTSTEAEVDLTESRGSAAPPATGEVHSPAVPAEVPVEDAGPPASASTDPADDEAAHAAEVKARARAARRAADWIGAPPAGESAHTDDTTEIPHVGAPDPGTSR